MIQENIKRILFLDDEPGTGRRLLAILSKYGYEVIVPGPDINVEGMIERGQIQLVIHTSHHSQTYQNQCQDILYRYPNLPSIHLSTGSCAREHNPITNQWRRSLRHLCPEKEFIKVVRRLIFTGEITAQNRLLEERLHLLARADYALDTIDVHEVKRKIAEFFASEFRAQNACFLNKGALEYFKSNLSKVVQMRQFEEDKTAPFQIYSARPLHENELRTILGEKRFENHFLIPVKDLGHVLVVQPASKYVNMGLSLFDDVIQKFSRHLEQMSQLSSAKDLNYIDDLTDLYNQRYLSMILEKEIGRAQRSHGQFSVLFMDIDHFKQVNDTKGHVIGSKCLVQVAKVLKKNVRSMDYAFRYGGDEFLVLLVGADSKTAQTVAERIRSQVEATVFEVENHQLKVTLSIGVATFPDHAQTKEQIIELADQAMYCGKHKSRNVVFVAS